MSGEARETIDVHLKRERKFSPVVKIPRQWPLILLVEVLLRVGKVVGSEKGKVLGNYLRFEHRRFVDPNTYCI